MVYWDTSALLKVYVLEPESETMVNLAIGTETPIQTSAITAVEMIAALARKERMGEMRRGGSREVFARMGQDAAAGRISIIPFDDDVTREAAKLVRLTGAGGSPILIRALDLIHVASAVLVRSKVVVTTDRRMRELAEKAGMKVQP